MSIARRVGSLVVGACFAGGALAACSGGSDDSSDELTGVATAAIANAPADVACLGIEVAGNRTVTKRYDVTPGQSSVFTMTGLPVGSVSFLGKAYAAACASVGGGTQPNWISDPVSATLVPAVNKNISLVLRHNGRSTVTVDFDDGDASADAGADAACGAGFLDCNGNPVDGCEVDVSSSPANCGACGFMCSAPNATSGCAAGACVIASCNAGFADCDANRANGCEVNLMTTPTHCGACGLVCPAGGACVAGACVPGTPSCTDGIRNGGETGVDCGGGVCAPCNVGANCTSNADCISIAYCGAGVCTPKKPTSAPCSSSVECASNACIFGLCQ